ncbi:unnamed protein product [Heligmosomoides polygyrus]|uniref:PDZ domain-containing protein n=1 Tax=Heligmosomoides polygyrus TaxID=6339 RepID=A0A3P8BV59_HELPZ|nr:unnamed protein product [Heligmosomoides polygyrus]
MLIIAGDKMFAAEQARCHLRRVERGQKTCRRCRAKDVRVPNMSHRRREGEVSPTSFTRRVGSEDISPMSHQGLLIRTTCHRCRAKQSENGQMDIEIPMEEGEPLGATPNDKLVITKIQGGTIADGKLKVGSCSFRTQHAGYAALQIGDQIIKVNGQPISDQNNFFKALRFAPPLARLTIIRRVVQHSSTSIIPPSFREYIDPRFSRFSLACSRDQKKAEELESRMRIPESRAKLIQRRDGYMYFMMKLVWVPHGPKLGLGIKHYQNRVLVSRSDPGSLSSTQLAVGDHIIDIDGVPVTDKDVARDLLIKALQEKKEVSSVIERPETMEAKHWTQQALATQINQPPSVQMNSDVRAIAARERARLKQPKQVRDPSRSFELLTRDGYRFKVAF